jgi:hypothetical protein
MVSLTIDPILISPNLLACLILLALESPSKELILNSHILLIVPPKIGPIMVSILACSLKETNHHHLLLNHPLHFSTSVKS